jgi:hypothetical protein
MTRITTAATMTTNAAINPPIRPSTNTNKIFRKHSETKKMKKY